MNFKLQSNSTVYVNLEYGEIKSRLIEPRSNEVEGGESTGYRVQSDNSQEKTVWRGAMF